MWNGSSGCNLQLQSSQTRPGFRSRMHSVNLTNVSVAFEARGEWGCWYQGPFPRGMFCIATCIADSVERISGWYRKQTMLCTWWKKICWTPGFDLQTACRRCRLKSKWKAGLRLTLVASVAVKLGVRQTIVIDFIGTTSLKSPWQTMRCPLKETSASTEPNKVLSSF